MEPVPENSIPEENVQEIVVPEELTKLSPPAKEDSQPQEEVVKEEVVKEPPTPRRAGRPKGSKDAKPRTTKKSKVVSVATEDVSNDKENVPELPRALPNSHPIPLTSYDDRSRIMLDMLARQAHERKTRKSDLWKSWFQ